MKKISFLVVLILFSASAQEKVTIEKLFRGEFSGEFFRGVNWSESGHTYYKMEDGTEGSQIFKVDISTGDKTLLAETKDFVPEGKTHLFLSMIINLAIQVNTSLFTQIRKEYGA
ncbi:MAG: hypothetical protein IPJ75_18575 [Ignavibacteriales bacterium]|nr:hypothetical protein [Ignavibacteriales bacterium]